MMYAFDRVTVFACVYRFCVQSRSAHALHTVACLHDANTTTGPGCIHTTQSVPV